MFKLFLNGGEAPSWRKILLELDAPYVAVSMYGLEKRLPKTKPWVLSKHFNKQEILMESGAFSFNKREEDLDVLENYAEKYFDFVLDNLERISLITEFDSLTLGSKWIESARSDFWDRCVPLEKFMPVWNPETGWKGLEALCERYRQVSLPKTPDQYMRLNVLVRKYGVKLHAASVSDFDLLFKVPFSSATTTSWLSPTRFGETIIWHSNRMVRYPNTMKEKARTRHRMDFIRANFSADDIAKDDPKEVARYTLWAFRQLENAVNSRRPINSLNEDDVTQSLIESDEPIVESDILPVVHTPSDKRHEIVVVPRTTRENLPVFSSSVKTTVIDGEEQEINVTRLSKRSLRTCDSCVLAGNCPAYLAEAECAYDIPVELNTHEQLLQFMKAIAEMQGQRVMFGKFAEDLQGGYPDANVSLEMDRFFRIVKMMKDIESNESSLKIHIEGKGQGTGVISRLFGPQKAEMPSLNRGQTEHLLAEITGIEDGEVID